MRTDRSSRSFSVRPKVVFFLFVLFTYAYFFQGGFANQNSRYDLALALAYEGTTSIDTFQANTIDVATFQGRRYSAQPPGGALLATPVAWITSQLVSVRLLRADHDIANMSLYFATIFSVGLISALAALAFVHIVRRLNPAVSEEHAFGISAVTFLATLILPYSTVLFCHQQSGSLLVMALFLVLYRRTSADGNDTQNARWWTFPVAGGICCGWSVITEYLSVFQAGAIAWIAWQQYAVKRVSRALFLAGLIPPAVVFMVYNFVSFRSTWEIASGNLSATMFHEGMTRGFFGISLPSWANALQLLFGMYRGLFVYSPAIP